MPDISTPNLDYGNMVEAWDINDALMGGTLYMRQLGEAYLPRWPKENKDDYKKRISVATLLPAYEETIKQNIGRVFAEPIKLAENVPDQLRDYAKNIDLEGTRLDVWAQSFFGLAMQYGLSHALVDYPRVDPERVKTKADEKATGARPYVTMLNPRQVIGWKSKMADGKLVLTALRIKEVVVEDGDDFGQTKVEQIRYLTPGKVEIYRKSRGTEGAANWEVFDQWETSRKDITLVTLYTKRTGFMCGSPPLLNMALLNIKHWQSQSEQDNILHVARVPILTVFGLEQGAGNWVFVCHVVLRSAKAGPGIRRAHWLLYRCRQRVAGRAGGADAPGWREAAAYGKHLYQIGRPDLRRENAGAVAALHNGHQPRRRNRQHPADHG